MFTSENLEGLISSSFKTTVPLYIDFGVSKDQNFSILPFESVKGALELAISS